MKLCGFDVGIDRPFFLISGPCVVESEQLQMDVAGRLQEITRELGIRAETLAPDVDLPLPPGWHHMQGHNNGPPMTEEDA